MLKLTLFGSPQVEVAGAPVEIGRMKSLALLAYLAETQSTHRRDHLATLLWPDYGQPSARSYLRQSLYTLTTALGDGWFQADRETLGMLSNTESHVDVQEFQELVAKRARALGTDSVPFAAPVFTHLAQAATLAQDEFLAGFSLPDAPEFDEWQFFQRENLRQTLAEVLDMLVSHLAAEQDFSPAIIYARRRTTLDPLYEPVQRTLMRLYTDSGQKPAALRQYDAYVRLLKEELGVPPADETTDLYQAIRQDKLMVAPLSRLQGIEDQDSRSATVSAESTPDPVADTNSLAEPPLPNNLPRQRTPFVGRENELSALDELLALGETRLVTIAAPGGMGKTRLGLAAAEQQLHRNRFPHGVYFIALAPLSDAGHIVRTIAEAIGFALESGRRRTSKQQILDYLREKELLLLLDNFEHLMEGTGLISDILQAAPGIQVLVTSRERLRMHGEQVFPIQGLDYGGAETGQVGSEYAAVRFFQQCARRIAPDHVLTPDDLVRVHQICHLVEGMPLAIELAAAWADLLSLSEIVEEIRRSLSFLETDMRDVPQRHQSIRAVFDATWQRLDETERGVFAALSVFRGGFTREAAREVAGATLRQLGSLADKSLLQHDWRESAGLSRYAIQELLRQYGAVKLAESPAVIRRARALHCAYYTGFLHARVEAINGSGQGRAVAEIAVELDNVRAAWQWAVDHADAAAIQRGAGAFFIFCQRRSHFLEGAQALEAAAAALTRLVASEERDLALAQVLNEQGWLCIRLGEFDRAYTVLEQSRAIYAQQKTPPPPYMGEDPATALSIVAHIRGEHDLAVRLGEEALSAGEARDDKYNQTHAHYALTSAWAAQGEYEVASTHAQQACALARLLGNRWFLAILLKEWGNVARALGDYDQAVAHYEASHDIMDEFDDPEGKAVALNHLGEIAILQMDHRRAQRLYQEALVIYRDTNDQGGLATSLRGLGQVASMRADYRSASRQFGQALSIAAETHFWPLLFTIMVDVGELLLQRGAHRTGVEALARVQHNAACDHETQRDAGQKLAHWRQRLDSDLFEDALRRGKEGALEAALFMLHSELTALARTE